MLKNIVNYLIANFMKTESCSLIFKYLNINSDDIRIIEIPLIKDNGIIILFENKTTSDSGYELYVGYNIRINKPMISIRTYKTDSDYDNDKSVNDIDVYNIADIDRIRVYFVNPVNKLEKIKNAIHNAVYHAANDNNVDLYDDSIDDIAAYIYGLLIFDCIGKYQQFKKHDFDFYYMHRLMNLSMHDSFEDINWFTESMNFNRMINNIIECIGC